MKLRQKSERYLASVLATSILVCSKGRIRTCMLPSNDYSPLRRSRLNTAFIDPLIPVFTFPQNRVGNCTYERLPFRHLAIYHSPPRVTALICYTLHFAYMYTYPQNCRLKGENELIL